MEDGVEIRSANASVQIDTVQGLKYYNADNDNWETLTTNQITNGEWKFDPTNNLYNDLSASDSQEIEITYLVTDIDGATSSEYFNIYVNGTNDAPTATYTTPRSVSEDQNIVSGAAFAEDGTSGIYKVNLAGHFANQEFSLDFAYIENNDSSSNVSSVDGLTISSSGELSFDTNHATYSNLLPGEDYVY